MRTIPFLILLVTGCDGRGAEPRSEAGPGPATSGGEAVDAGVPPSSSARPSAGAAAPPERPAEAPVVRGAQEVVATVDARGADLVLSDGALLSIGPSEGREPFVARLEIESNRRKARQLGPRYHVTIETRAGVPAALYLPYVAPKRWSNICNVTPSSSLTVRGEWRGEDGGRIELMRAPEADGDLHYEGAFLDRPRKARGALLALDPGYAGTPAPLDARLALFDSHPC